MAETEKKSVTGLDQASNRKEAEYDLLESLLTAAEYKTDEENITEARIERNKKFLFSVHLHPISEPDMRFARKKATIYMKNPNGKNLPPIEKDFNNTLFNSWIIYLATTEEDQQKIWGNPAFKQKHGLMENVESIDVLLHVGEKRRLSDLVMEISGMDDEGEYDEETDETTGNMSQEEYAKN